MFVDIESLRPGEEILIRRRRNGLNYRGGMELAARQLGITANYLSDIELGRVTTSNKILETARKVWPLDQCPTCQNQLFVIYHNPKCISPACRCVRTKSCPDCMRPRRGAPIA